MYATLYRTDGSNNKIKIESFVDARSIVCNFDPNGLAEVVRLGNGSLLLIDEEGKVKNYPINKIATSLAHLHESIYPHDYIAGDAFLFENENDFEELDYEQ